MGIDYNITNEVGTLYFGKKTSYSYTPPSESSSTATNSSSSL